MKFRILFAFVAAVLLCGCSVSPVKWDSPDDASRDLRSNSSFAVSSAAKPADSKAVSSMATDNTASIKQNFFYNDIKAVWISYLELEPILKDKSESYFKNKFASIIKNVANLGLNTVIVQVRPFADALYPSEIFPPSAVWTSDMKPASFDPLEIMLKTAHESKISFHAWINPLRGATKSQVALIDGKYKVKALYNGKNKAKLLGGRYYFNPAYGDVKRLIANGVEEIVKNYNVDAIHIDDYFYPTTAKSFDAAAYEKYANGRSLSRFRLDNCNDMVNRIYTAAHTAKNVKFGISPQGSIRNNYGSQYADVKLWCSKNGYADYIMPQIYYGFLNSSEPFKKVCREWASCVTNKNIILTAGLACHKINMAVDAYAGVGKGEWAKNSDVISRQIKYLSDNDDFSGFSLYSYKSIFGNKQAKSERENIRKILKSD